MWKYCFVLFFVIGFSLLSACGGKADVDCAVSPDFATCVAPILEKSCTGAGCHGKTTPAADLTLSGIKASDLTGKVGKAGGLGLKMVVAGDPNTSLLYLKLLEADARPVAAKPIGSPMPIGPKKSTFTAANTATIKLWIEKGAK